MEIYLQNETIWLTQQKIAELFGVDRSVVTKHLANIYTEGKLSKVATCVKIAQVQLEGDFDTLTKNLKTLDRKQSL